MSTTWFVPRSDLSDDQLRAVELTAHHHCLILGAPGSGKTLVLLHRARRMIEEEGVRPDRLRIFVFTNTLKDYIRSALGLLDIPEECVVTFDHWCREFYTTFVRRRVPFAKRQPDFDAIREGVLAKLQGGSRLTALGDSRTRNDGAVQDNLFGEDNAPEVEPAQGEFPEFFAKVIGCPLYDAVLVDEGQDLTAEAFEILRRISAHVTVCMDAKQQLYEMRCGEPEILHTLGLQKCNMTILGAYRCCPYITDLAARLLRDDAEREAFLNQTRTEQRERLTPLLYIGANAQEEKARIVQIIRDRQLTGDRIAVLMPNNAKLFSLAKTLTGAGLEVEVPSKGRNTDYLTHDFQTERPKLMTYYGAKGLTFETVIMPRLVNTSFLQVAARRLEKLLFVGMTRATQWVYMSTVEGQIPPVVVELATLEREGTITIQRSGDDLPLFGSRTATTPSQDEVAVDSLTDLF